MLLRASAGESSEPGLWPSEVARLYGVPSGHDGAGQCVGVIALGGGYLPNDLAEATRAMGVKAPLIIDSTQLSVQNIFGVQTEADEELALDLQVLAGVAPEARIVVYFAEASRQGLADALAVATSDDVNRPGVLSISWGSAERFWLGPARDSVEKSLARAKDLKMTVVAASGDLLATAGLMDGTANVMYPASSPSVLACGGSTASLDKTGSALAGEEVWNDVTAGTGGGISSVFDVPGFQGTVKVPTSFKDGKRGRGVPDVAAAASPSPGYRIVVNGQTLVKDGTSAATPLWAAIVTLANAQRGSPVGFVNERLYGSPQLFRDITQGNNRDNGVGYDAAVGWDACTGLGTPWAEQVIESLMTMG